MTKIKENKLNTVTGGDYFETSVDSMALKYAGYMPEEFNEWHTFFNWIEDSRKVDEGWGKAGIISVTRFLGDNWYYSHGKQISRKEAMRMIGIYD